MNDRVDRRTIARPLASFVAGLDPSDVPDAVLNVVERSVVDTVGVIRAGWDERETAIARASVDPDAVGLLADDGSERSVAFANGVAGHCLDFDDCWQGGAIHPSVTVVPALLATADVDTAGAELLAAYAAGVETQGHLAGYLLPDHYEAGWHTTATLGTFGVAAAISNLLGLDADAAENALNLAASLPGGLKRNFGTTTKSVHVGQSARSGVTAARLAENGATADERAIGGERGFVELYDGDPTRSGPDPDDLGSAWTLLDPGIQLKKFPCCNYTHSSVEAALRLRERTGAAPEDVDRVSVSISRGAAETVTHEDPQTPLEAKFSFDYPVAAALAGGSVTLETFEPDAIEDPAVQRVRERVAVEVDPDLSYQSLRAEVAVDLADGDRSSIVVEGPPGAGPNPLSEAELREKFRQCVAGQLDPDRADDLFEFLRSLRDRDSLQGLEVQ